MSHIDTINANLDIVQADIDALKGNLNNGQDEAEEKNAVSGKIGEKSEKFEDAFERFNVTAHDKWRQTDKKLSTVANQTFAILRNKCRSECGNGRKSARPQCHRLHVTGSTYLGDDNENSNGEYVLFRTDVFKHGRPNFVFKHVSKSRYMFLDDLHWVIGDSENSPPHHNSGLIKQEPWEGQWFDTFHTSRGKVVVSCAGDGATHWLARYTRCLECLLHVQP